MSAPASSTRAVSVSSDPAAYPLGRTPAEARRLELQHAIYADATCQFLSLAGVSGGMRVLEVGSGTGDVSLLLADLVGPSGEVVGVEFAPESIAVASRRADAAGVGRRVSFVSADLRDVARVRQLVAGSHGERRVFDAVVGRWVLMYLPRPADLVRGLAELLGPGGIVAFQESDLVDFHPPHPPSPLHDRIRSWLTPPDGLMGGPDAQMGPKLFATFLAAGLPTPSVRIDTPAGGGTEWPGYQYVAETVRSLLPFITELGRAEPDDIGIDTLASRLRDEITSANGLLPLASLYGAWTTAP